MANLTQTAANVGVQGACQLQVVQVGEAVTQGQPGYYNSSDNKYYQTDANVSSTTAGARCVFMTAASTDGYSIAAFEGDVNLGATLTVGQTYVVSATKGAICPIADLTTADYVTVLGVASAATTLKLKINASGVVKP